MAQVVVEVDGTLANPEQQGAIEGDLLLDEPHQGGRKGAAVQGIDGIGQGAGERGVGHGGVGSHRGRHCPGREC
ncbi:hypothetical protein D3C84_1218120 [compost metagenome]